MEVSTMRGEELREELRLTELSGQDVNAGESNRRAVHLGKIIHRFSDYLWSEANHRHQDVPKCLHGLSPDHAICPLCMRSLVGFVALLPRVVKGITRLCRPP